VPDPAFREALQGAIRENAPAAADALTSIQLGAEERIDFDGLRVGARVVGRSDTFEAFVIEQLAARKLVRAFVLAMVARDVSFPVGWEQSIASEDAPVSAEVEVEAGDEPEFDDDDDDPVDVAKALAGSNIPNIGAFENKVRAFRCRVLINGMMSGSGFLVGPSTVMTAWHVIAPADDIAGARIEVALAGGEVIAAFIPVIPYSKCSDNERAGRLPKDDAEVQDLHDVAILTLTRPAGAALGVARLADSARIRPGNTILVAHFPGGRDLGLGIGAFRKLRRLTSRWGHTVRTLEGSSGAACFDASLHVAGIHQGRAPKQQRGRLVPVSRFPEEFLKRISEDEAPPALWSLDGTTEGQLVIGRQEFFLGFAAASRAVTRVRGIRVKRLDAAADETGIPFTFLMLQQLVVRSLDTRILRISFEALVADFADEVVSRAEKAGMPIPAIGPLDGVSADQSSPDAVASDRGRRVAMALEAMAARDGLRLWIFIEHPSVVFGEELRSAFDGFVDQGLRSINLRLVIAGFEAVNVPGLEFQTAAGAGEDGSPGLVVEYIDGFRRSDVETLLRRAAESFEVQIPEAVIGSRADDALTDIPNDNGVYSPWRAGTVIDALRPVLRKLAQRSPRGVKADGDGAPAK
jgi:V8-like Glu-specific endopeptidase